MKSHANIVLNAWLCLFVYLAQTQQRVMCEIPPEVEKCHYEEQNCLTKTAQFVIDKYAKIGTRGLNLVPLDPLHINLLQLERNTKSPVNIELKFKDIDLIGLQNIQVLKLKGLDKDIKKTIEFESNIPKLKFKGSYQTDGSVLILPIVGKGDSEIILENTKTMVKIKPKAVQKNGKTHFEIDQIKMILVPKRAYYRLDNLFNGNKELSDNMNVFLNENWQDIFNELEPEISKALSLIIKQIINNVFAKYPYADYFQAAA